MFGESKISNYNGYSSYFEFRFFSYFWNVPLGAEAKIKNPRTDSEVEESA